MILIKLPWMCCLSILWPFDILYRFCTLYWIYHIIHTPWIILISNPRIIITISPYMNYRGVRIMVFNATFNNILVISWQLVLLVEETGVPRENHWPAESHWQTFWQNVVYWVHLAWTGFTLTTLVVIGTDCIGCYKSNDTIRSEL